MTSEILELIFKAKDEASAVIARLREGTKGISAAGDVLNNTFKSPNITSFTDGIKGLIVQVGALFGAYKGFQALLSIPFKGLEFTKELETAKLGIASIIAATQELITQDGRKLEGVEKLNEAQKIAADLMKQIQIAGLETTATTQELVTGFQALLGPASSAGMTLKQTKDITVATVQAMGSMGIAMNQLSAEGRSLSDGSINPMQDRLAVALGITGEMVNKWREQGALFDELMKKLEPFRIAGVSVAETWEGLFSNLKESIAFIGSKIVGGIFEDIKSSLKTVLDAFIDIRNFDVGSGIKNLIEGFKEIGKDIGYIIKVFAEGFVNLLKRANEYAGEHKKELSAIWETVKQIGGQFWELIKQAGTFALSIVKIGTEGGVFLAILKLANIAFAAMNDIVGWIILGFKTIAAVIYNTIVPPLADAAKIIGEILKVIPGFREVGSFLIETAKSLGTQQALVNKELEESAAKYRDGISPHMQKALQTNQQIEEAIKKQNAALDESTVKVEKAKKTYEEIMSSLKEGTAEYVSIKEKELKTLKTQIDYEIALYEQQYREGIISLTEFLDEKRNLQERYLNEFMKLKEMEIEILKKAPEKNLEKIKEIEEEIKQVRIKSAQDQIKIQEDFNKEVKKIHKDELDVWESLQELKIQTLISHLDLQNTVEETMVKRGIMRQSELLENQFERWKKIQEAKIQKAEETMNKISELEGDTEKYNKAMREREKLQGELEAKIIASEQQIADAKEKEELDALRFVAEITGDRIKLTVKETEDRIKEIKKYYEQGIIKAEDYYDALSQLEKEYTSEFKLELKERTEQLNLAISIITERRKRLTESVSSLLTEGWEDVKKWFGDWRDAVSITTSDVQAQINAFMRQTSWASHDAFQNASIFGRRFVEMVGTSIYEWSARVAEYINYVKSLLASLQDYITSLRIQLAQLRGDRELELELQYQQELKKLEERYGEELQSSQEYQEALMLLNEIYAEKRKKLREQEQEEIKKFYSDMKDMAHEEKESESKGGGPASIQPIRWPWQNLTENFNKSVQEAVNEVNKAFGREGIKIGPEEIKIKKEVLSDFTVNLNAPHYDPESTSRWVDNTLLPILSHKLKLRGLDLL